MKSSSNMEVSGSQTSQYFWGVSATLISAGWATQWDVNNTGEFWRMPGINSLHRN